VISRALVRLAVLVLDGVGGINGVNFIASSNAVRRRITAHCASGRRKIDAPVRTVLEEDARAQDVALVDVEFLAMVARHNQYMGARCEI
jgi:hypothetical protein